MLSPLVLAALVALVKVIFETYLPQFPVTAELIYSVIVVILGWFGLEVFKAGVKKFTPNQSHLFKSE